MRILILMFCSFVTAWCGETTPSPRWDALPAAARTLVDRILEKNRLLEPELDADAARRAFGDLVESCRPPTGVSDAQEIIRILNAKILTGREVSYLSRQYWRDSSFSAALLRKQGNCLATTTLYVAIGRALSLPIRAVFVPEHAFACWADGVRRINIETTAGGVANSDISYMARFAIDNSDFSYFGWMAPMEDSRLLAELDLIAAQHLHGQLRFTDAQASLKLAQAGLSQRSDLNLLAIAWSAELSGDRTTLLTAAEHLAADQHAPRAATLAAVRTLASEHRARLDRNAERAALQRAYALAPWHEQDEILELLSLCLRGLRDHAGAVLCMELAVARNPENLWKRAWLAGMLTEANRIDEGLKVIAAVRQENPEEVFFAIIHAGTMVQAGQRTEGRKLFDALQAPRTNLENYEINRAWFLAVWGDRATFYPQFEKTLNTAKDPSVLSWIAEDDDLDQYRKEERFKTTVEACRQRLLGTSKGR